MSTLPARLLIILMLCGSGCGKSAKTEVKSDVNYSKEVMEIAEWSGSPPEVVAEVRSLPSSELKKLTNAYVIETGQSDSYWQLRLARDLAVPFLISVLEREDAFKKNAADMILPESPGSRALAFLKMGEHPELKPHLLKWAATGDENVLRKIDSHLVAFGSDDLLGHVEMLFEHPDMFVSSGARSGALDAIKAGRAEPRFREYVWEHSVKLLQSKKPPGMYDPIRLMMALDEKAAQEVLLSPAVMRVDFPLLPEALSTLNGSKNPPPADFLDNLVQNAPPVPVHRRHQLWAAAIAGLILHKDPRASNYVESILSEPEKHGEELVLSAWKSRFRIHGRIPILDQAYESYEKADYQLGPLSQEEKDIILIGRLDSEVKNGGFWQWYSNADGRNFEETAKAQEKLGANKHANLVRQANRLFGSSGPSREREKMEAALEKMPDKEAVKMDALSDAWYDLPSWLLQAYEWEWQRSGQ